jgi:phage shock protein E
MKPAQLAFVLLFPVAGAAVAGCSSAPPADAAALAADTIVLDVRNQDEWDAGHLERAHLLPLPQLSQRLAEIEQLTGGDKNRTIVVVCRSGTRAGQARKLLEAAGYTRVINGGAWQSLQVPAKG